MELKTISFGDIHPLTFYSLDDKATYGKVLEESAELYGACDIYRKSDWDSFGDEEDNHRKATLLLIQDEAADVIQTAVNILYMSHAEFCRLEGVDVPKAMSANALMEKLFAKNVERGRYGDARFDD